jgi:hypothetical protein
MYETRQEEDMIRCHYEVARIYIKPAHTAFGVDFEEAEVLTSNEKFFYDGSGAFIKKDNAMKHFLKTHQLLVSRHSTSGEFLFYSQSLQNMSIHNLLYGITIIRYSIQLLGNWDQGMQSLIFR